MNWYNPDGLMKAIFGLLSGSIVTCQYALFRSMVEKMAASERESRIAMKFGRG